MKFCTMCGTPLNDDARFCSACGAKQIAVTQVTAAKAVTPEAGVKVVNPQNVTVEKTPCEAPTSIMKENQSASVADNPKNTAKINLNVPLIPLIRSALILIASIFVLISSFMPVCYFPLEDVSGFLGGDADDIRDIKFGLNAIEQTTLVFDSFKELDSGDIKDSDLYEEITELMEEFADFDVEDIEDLSSKERRKMNKMLFLFLRAEMQSEGVGITTPDVVSAVFGLIYIVFAVAFLVFAIFNLLKTIGLIPKLDGKGIQRKAIGMLSAAPAMLLATYVASYMSIGGKLSKISVWSIVISVLVIAVAMVLRWIFTKRDSVGVVITRMVATSLAVATFCLAFAPVFSASFKTELKNGKVTNITVNHKAVRFSEFYIPSESHQENVEYVVKMSTSKKISYFKNKFDTYKWLSKAEATQGAGEIQNIAILSVLLSSKVQAPIPFLFSLGYIPFILMAIATLLILWQNLYFFAAGKYSAKTVWLGKILSAIFAVCALAIAIFVVIFMQGLIEDYLIRSYSFGVGAGVILMVVFAVCSMFCPTRVTQKKQEKITFAEETNNLE
ncbi:MAG: zinc ribbon domain-containing protein [Clostridia bacterium]|nr:zinc ribbon domain-containing protein [Clostridia bacterium]